MLFTVLWILGALGVGVLAFGATYIFWPEHWRGVLAAATLIGLTAWGVAFWVKSFGPAWIWAIAFIVAWVVAALFSLLAAGYPSDDGYEAEYPS